jgi:hypothetical protein|tara:strand:+ start:165 stop:335 length:171 start_codon:yes stop_codon:yes gene_type:complete
MKWVAFDNSGQAYSLGDCGDYDVAVEIANEYLVPKDKWVFILSESDLQEIMTKIRR